MSIKDEVKKVIRFGKAWRRWGAAAKRPERWKNLPGIIADSSNRPIRTNEAIAELFAICSSNECGKFIAKGHGQGKCKLCGCRLNLEGRINKFYLATESCPAKPPMWESPIPLTDEEAESEPAKMEIEMTEREKEMMERRKHLLQARREQDAVEKMPKQETRREKRMRERSERIKAREERIKRRQAIEASNPTEFTPSINDDPLMIYGRDRQPIGHALRDMWCDQAAFLVCGGPSTLALDMSVLQERGIVSLGVNNVAAHYKTTAFICGDPPEKFHHAIFFDPSIKKFVPEKRMRHRVRVKLEDGTFKPSSRCVMHCPETYGYRRDSIWEPENFFKREAATWGCGQGCVEQTKHPKILFTFFTALRLLHYFGVRRVYMLGVDFMMSADYGYSFSQARWSGAVRGNNDHYQIAAPMCDELVPVFKDAVFEVFNCNERSGLRAFPYVPFDEAVEDCRGLVPAGPLDCSGWYEKFEEDRGGK